MRKNISGIFALLLVGGFYAYRNRAAIQKYLESVGIDLPELFRGQTSRIREGLEYAKRSVQGEGLGGGSESEGFGESRRVGQ